jgi:7,8-dihydroneopterin aldolase/epimerase/oxygenase
VTDRIELRGLRVVASCGVLAEEHARRQPFEIDVDLCCDLSAAGASDALDDTVDYGAVCDELAAVAAERHHELMEHLAHRLAVAVLRHDRVTEVDLVIRKLRPPVAHDLATAGVRVVRGR